MLSKFFKQSWLVMVAALAFGLLVAGVHGQLSERIKRNAREKLEREMRSLLGAESTFEQRSGSADGGALDYFVATDKGGAVVGYASEAIGSGFADKIKLLVAFDAGLENLLGIAVLKSNETPGFGDKIKDASFKDQFNNCPVGAELVVIKTGDRSVADDQIVAITGATVSSEAVTIIVNEAVIQIKAVLEKFESATTEPESAEPS